MKLERMIFVHDGQTRVRVQDYPFPYDVGGTRKIRVARTVARRLPESTDRLVPDPYHLDSVGGGMRLVLIPAKPEAPRDPYTVSTPGPESATYEELDENGRRVVDETLSEIDEEGV